MKQVSKHVVLAVGLVIASLTFFAAQNVFAQTDLTKDVMGQLNTGATESGLRVDGVQEQDPRIFIAQMINMLLGAYVIIFVILMVHAGHLLITAQGNDEQIKKSYKIIIGAVIGLAIVLTAYSVSNYVSKAALKATNYGNGL